MRFDARLGIVAAVVSLASAAAAAPDIKALATGRTTYRISIDGKPIGEQVLTIKRVTGDRYAVTMDAPGIGQSWKANSDAGFRPIATRLQMTTRAGPYSMSLRYGGGRVTGYHGTSLAAVDAVVPPGIVDQRVDWAYVSAARLPRGAPLTFQVYDPGTGVSQAEARGLGLRWVDVAGKRTYVRSTAYRIVKASGEEAYVVHVAARGPAVMVREDMPHGLRIDLTAFAAD